MSSKGKSPLNAKTPRKTRRLQRRRFSLYTDKRLLASSKIPEAKILQLIRCYAEEKSVRQTMSETGLSHVTVYKLFGMLRERLLYAGMYESFHAYYDEHFGPKPKWKAQPVDEYIVARTLELSNRTRRYWPDDNGEIAKSEALFRVRRIFTSRDTYRLIILVLHGTGPLNRPPRPFKDGPFEAERSRVILREQIIHIRDQMRKGNLPGGPAIIDYLESDAKSRIREAMERSRSLPDDE